MLSYEVGNFVHYSKSEVINPCFFLVIPYFNT